MRAVLGLFVRAVMLVVMMSATSVSAQFLYSGASFDATLHTVDPATGGDDASIGITAAGYTFTQVKGLAAEPTTGELYAVLRGFEDLEGVEVFYLATVRPDTGVATVIGQLPDRFAGLAFASDGTLYGVTGDGGTVPETLYTIDPANAAATFFMTLGNGTAGETIAYNSNDGMLYHLSGQNVPVDGSQVPLVFESVDLSTMVITPIPLTGDFFANGNGLAYDDASGGFVVSAIVTSLPDGGVPALVRLSTAGVATTVGAMTHFSGGMALTEYVPVELQFFTVD